MRTAQAGLGVSGAQFNALVENLVTILSKFTVTAQEQKELLAILGPMKTDIVTR
jgi:hemoglobin